MAREAKVAVARKQLPHPVRDGPRAYKVVLDGKVVSKLGMGDSVEFSCEPGLHRLWMKLDFKRSNTIAFTVEPDQTARFGCQPGGHYLRVLVDLFRAGKYISVRQLGDDEEPVS
jgi:hypothetical protein